MNAWRCFVAMPLGDDLRRRLASAIEIWCARSDGADLRWTDAAALHLTLAFLSSVEPGSVDRLAAAIGAAVEPEPPTTLETGGVGAFPNAGHGRVAWYGVADPDRSLEHLATGVRQAVGLLADPHPFRPHVTLARTRGQRAVDLRSWIREANPPAGELDVHAVHLMRSHLGDGPARYEVLSSTPLRGAVHA